VFLRERRAMLCALRLQTPIDAVEALELRSKYSREAGGRRDPSTALTQWLLRAPRPTHNGCFKIPIRYPQAGITLRGECAISRRDSTGYRRRRP
jgi:hypothetical protein